MLADFNRGFAPKPVQVGKEYDVDVTEISRQGDGIARVKVLLYLSKTARLDRKSRFK
jgi:predicted RNA-binding protein with TRAM domain